MPEQKSTKNIIRLVFIFFLSFFTFIGEKTFASSPKKVPSGIIFKDNKYIATIDNMEMVFVPAGEFIMGSHSGNNNEQPEHKVFLDSFFIDIHEVTNAQFEKFVISSAYKPTGPWRRGYNPGQEKLPVRFVTWHDALAYVKWAGRSLATEAQWEKAARGPDGLKYPWGNKWKDAPSCKKPSSPFPVGSFPGWASPYGGLDMSGNVWEWVGDWYDRFYYKNFQSGEVVANPIGPPDEALPEKRFQDTKTAAGNERSTLKVVRGGGFCNQFQKENARTSKRMWANPNYWFEDTGFRCALLLKIR